MTAFRLDSLQPRLAEAFRRAPAARRREAARLACERAALAAELSGPEITAALGILRAAGRPEAALRERLEASAARLDDEYFRLDQEGTDADKPKALRLFSEARATSAIAFALSSDDGELHEALYEALAAVDDPSDMVRDAEAALG